MKAWLAALRPPEATGFVLRTLFAFMLALRIAYGLELDAPYSAGVTVFIVAAGARGAVLSKSLYRFLGSLAGILASIALIAAFAQAPLLFVLALALWLGLCSAAASLLRYFRSYGMVLAGYTATLVAVPAAATPDRIFAIATARLAVVSLGVGVTALVFLLTDRGLGAKGLRLAARNLLRDTTRFLRDALNGLTDAELTRRRAAIAVNLLVFDQSIEFTSVEDATFGLRAQEPRTAAALLFAVLTGARRLATLLAPSHQPTPSREFARETMQAALGALCQGLGSTAPDFPALARICVDARQALAAMLDRAAPAASEPVPALSDLSALAASETLLDELRGALTHFASLAEGGARTRAEALPVYANWVTALRNGLRTFLAASLAGVFWIMSQWPQGGTALAILGPITGLMALTESASAASLAFFQGALLSALVALPVREAVLPQITGFPLLMAVLLPIMAVALIYSRRPGLTGTRANGFLIFFLTQVAPANPMRFDLAGALNTSLALVAGGFAGMLAFRVLVPPDPAAEARVLMRSIRRAVLHALRTPIAHELAWEHLQHQKLVRLSLRLAANPVIRPLAINRAITAVLIGRFAQQIRATSPNLPVLAAIAEAGHSPLVAATAAHDAALGLAASPTTRLAAALNGIADLLDETAPFLTRASL